MPAVTAELGAAREERMAPDSVQATPDAALRFSLQRLLEPSEDRRSRVRQEPDRCRLHAHRRPPSKKGL
jgi:hypothetical protein